MEILLRRKILISLVLCASALTLAICAFAKLDGHGIIDAKTAQIVPSVPQSPASVIKNIEGSSSVPAFSEKEDTPLFIIRLVGSELRVVSASDESQYTVIENADARTFRDNDRLRLIDGVKVYSEGELAQIIEDFSS